ncbi:calcium-transporting ATPase 5, plasma membrane-type isoform X1 [Cryptomeria japonica]|uniref:calcium-transporting ATPase 5, plasma membrane-type isoform X1 n=1 Tax=Cryptomeria japonica TaxID=3369 RepID=UPI0027DA5F97|nr:calcium-transporting ATPase 5, plasma membrane-type isoform X1 [Cryptomeria japonica]
MSNISRTPRMFSPGRTSLDDYQKGIFVDDEEEKTMSTDVFDIPNKKAPLERLKKWRQATLALNATRRFRYTLNLKREEQREETISKIRAHAQAVRAAHRFKQIGGEKKKEDDDKPPEGFGISAVKLAQLVRDKDFDSLQQIGGVKEVAKLLHTDADKGIKENPEELLCRRNAYGENTYPQKAARNFFVFLWEACQDTTLIILMICAALSLGFQIKTEGIKEGWYDGGSIAFAVILVIFVTAISDYRQSLQFQNLNEEKRNIQLQVIRGGRRFKVSIFDLLVGDVLPLNIGDQVPADGILIEGHSLSIDESSMTGESKFVHKDQKNPFLMSGCKVADGYGTMLVTGVGLNTEWGVLMASISEDNGEETPLQVRLNGVATFIGKVGLTVAVVVLIVLLIRYFTGHTEETADTSKFKAGKTKFGDAMNGVVEIFAIAVTIVVVAVPEGLPLAVTLTLAYSMRKMMRDKALVRRLSACETMGSATTICSDKTGTLTLNQMTVVKACVAGEMNLPPESTSVAHNLLKEGISQNTTGSIFKPEGGGQTEVTGSPTEKAILSWALEFGMNFDEEKSKSSILQVVTFNSEKKRGGVALKKLQLQSPSEVHIHWKGAAEIILDLCSSWMDSSGVVQNMSPSKSDEFKTTIEGMAAASLRCVAFAYRTYDTESIPREEVQLESWEIPEDNLTLLAIVGIKDPCRPSVKEAVNLCQNAGVKVRMVTGDNIYTARAIALECDILKSDQSIEMPTVIEGKDFRALTEEERNKIVDKICVMARSSPTDKLLLVQALKRNGEVVAVTGDGTNDAPALHEADIGLSMGIQGTEVAKESSDIIILDDNFSSVVKVVRWGRSVYANIQKFIQFQLTVNVAALTINFVAAISSGNVPLNAVQLLWVNLIMDTLGALALATEPPTDHLMHRPPVGRREPLITNIMWRNLIAQAIYQIIVLLTLTFKGKDILNLKDGNVAGHADKLRNTIIFNAFVFCQIFNEFNARKPDQKNIFRGLHKNRLFIGIICMTLILQVIIVEFLKKFAKTTQLNPKQWILCIVIGFLSWPIAAVVKCIPVPERPFADYLRKKSKRKESSAPGEASADH